MSDKLDDFTTGLEYRFVRGLVLLAVLIFLRDHSQRIYWYAAIARRIEEITWGVI